MPDNNDNAAGDLNRHDPGDAGSGGGTDDRADDLDDLDLDLDDGDIGAGESDGGDGGDGDANAGAGDDADANRARPKPRRDNPIPYSKVRKIVANKIKKAREEWDGEIAPSRQRLTQLEQLGSILERDPDQFFELMDRHGVHPRYSEVRKLLGGARGAEGAAGSGADTRDPRPQPDVDLGQGRKTYSVEGLQKLEEWSGREVERRVLAAVGEKLKPIEDYHRQTQTISQLRAQADEARREWSGFADHEKDVIAYMRQHPQTDLHSAYRKVVVPKLEERGRKRAIDEMKRAPKSTSAAAGGGGGRRPSGEDLDAKIGRIYDELAAQERQ